MTDSASGRPAASGTVSKQLQPWPAGCGPPLDGGPASVDQNPQSPFLQGQGGSSEKGALSGQTSCCEDEFSPLLSVALTAPPFKANSGQGQAAPVNLTSVTEQREDSSTHLLLTGPAGRCLLRAEERVRLVERGSPHSLPLMESGKILPGVRIIIANPETKGPLGDSHLGE
ncbi:hypothetical protein MC885_001999, partial [Smutsia gigantea]